MRLFWQLFPASGILEFSTIGRAAKWADEFLAANPTATIERVPA